MKLSFGASLGPEYQRDVWSPERIKRAGRRCRAWRPDDRSVFVACSKGLEYAAGHWVSGVVQLVFE